MSRIFLPPPTSGVVPQISPWTFGFHCLSSSFLSAFLAFFCMSLQGLFSSPLLLLLGVPLEVVAITFVRLLSFSFLWCSPQASSFCAWGDRANARLHNLGKILFPPPLSGVLLFRGDVGIWNFFLLLGPGILFPGSPWASKILTSSSLQL